MRKAATLIVAVACVLAGCGGGSSPSRTDPEQVTKLRPLTAKAAAPRVQPGPLERVAPALDRICADTAKRAAKARQLGADADLIAEAAAQRLSRLVGGVPRPTDADSRYGGWTDSLKTVVNLYRLADSSGGDKAKALREQARRTAAASRKTAGQLGLTDCAR